MENGKTPKREFPECVFAIRDIYGDIHEIATSRFEDIRPWPLMGGTQIVARGAGHLQTTINVALPFKDVAESLREAGVMLPSIS